MLSIANPALSYRVSDVFKASESRFALVVGMPKSRMIPPLRAESATVTPDAKLFLETYGILGDG